MIRHSFRATIKHLSRMAKVSALERKPVTMVRPCLLHSCKIHDHDACVKTFETLSKKYLYVCQCRCHSVVERGSVC